MLGFRLIICVGVKEKARERMQRRTRMYFSVTRRRPFCLGLTDFNDFSLTRIKRESLRQ